MTKKKVSITISKDLIEWLDLQIKEGRFANRSDAFDYCIRNYRKKHPEDE